MEDVCLRKENKLPKEKVRDSERINRLGVRQVRMTGKLLHTQFPQFARKPEYIVTLILLGWHASTPNNKSEVALPDLGLERSCPSCPERWPTFKQPEHS